MPNSIPNIAPGAGLDQGRFSTCAFHAVATVLDETLSLRYNIGLDREAVITHLEDQIMMPNDGFNGAMVEDVISQINAKNKRGTPQHAKFRCKNKGEKYCVTVQANEVTFEKLYQIMGEVSGVSSCVAVIKTDNAGHERHAVAVFGRAPRKTEFVLKARNSWGTKSPLLDVSESNFVAAYMLEPTLHFIIDAEQNRQDPPPETKDWSVLHRKVEDVTSRIDPTPLGQFVENYSLEYNKCLYTGRLGPNGYPEGLGSLTDSVYGRVYEGKWASGKMNGHVQETRPDGHVLTFNWKNHDRDGWGEVHNTNSGVKMWGTWKDDNINTP